MLPADLPSFLLTGAPGIYCAGLLMGFDSLMQRRNRALEPESISGHEEAARLLTERSRDVQVSVATSPEAIAEAARLVTRRYAWRGYEAGHAGADSGELRPAGAHEITFLARNDDATLGTLTLRVDSAHGLRAEEGYPDAISSVRADGRRVCELTRLALDETSDWKPVLASLFSLAYAMGRSMHGVTDVFIEVNPRHVGFYQRALGFVVAAGERFCERVKAPSVLLKLELADLERRLRLEPPPVMQSGALNLAAAAV
ncbi:MAG: hypothetical protein MUC55_14470 [Burkholderiales bacterium]|jgi:hypothetical protein|nr:hypothetical protein [Burkholderiales bacterium]